ncbi:MAG: glutaredoxin family protein [Promethearchaeota archaeon]
MTKIEIFEENVCPNCKKLKAFLDEKGISYAKLNIQENQDNKVEALMNNIFALPALRIAEDILRAKDMISDTGEFLGDIVLKFINERTGKNQ